jgi:hypothetical protein
MPSVTLCESAHIQTLACTAQGYIVDMYPAAKYLLVVAMCVSSCATTGCIGSSFTLASESRLPTCITLPPGLTRKDVSVTLYFHTAIHGDNVSFILKDLKGRELSRVRGTTGSGGSLYHLVHTDKGTNEIIELIPYGVHENMKQNGQAVALFFVDQGAHGEIFRH